MEYKRQDQNRDMQKVIKFVYYGNVESLYTS